MPDGSSLHTVPKHHPVLVVNCDGTPIAYPKFSISWRKALKMMVMGVATPQELSPYVARAQNVDMQVPTVVMLHRHYNFDSLGGTATCSLPNLYLRDRGRCMYTDQPLRLCGNAVQRAGGPTPGDMATLDHYIPKSQGGRKTWRNSALASFEVNNRKLHHTPEAVGLRLKYEMWTPTAGDLLSLWLSEERLRQVDESWLEYLGKIQPSYMARKTLERVAA